MPARLMLVPSSACPASCAYCFGPHAGGAVMRRETLEAIVEWQRALGEEGRPGDSEGGTLEVTFHGGEPLVPGVSFYREALPLLRDGLAPRRVRFGMQSNLWLLTDESAQLFAEYGVRLGTSLDGPEVINDAQRGAGYFARTMAGVERARAHGVSTGVICTLTAQSAPHADAIFDFFQESGLDFSLHGALLSAHDPEAAALSISAEAYGEVLVGLFDRYLQVYPQMRISTFDSMAQSVSAGCGGVCTFTDCLGDYLAVGPDGGIYPCQRFVGLDEYRLGDVANLPDMRELQMAPAWKELDGRQAAIEGECGDCACVAFCRGGCPHSAAAGGQPAGRDPHCSAYRRVFAHITARALEEVFAPENLEAVVRDGAGDRGLLHRGRLLSLMVEDVKMRR